MKKYGIPVQWIQRGVVSMEAENLKEAVSKAEGLDLGTLNLVGQNAPGSTRIVYNGLRQYTPDEQLSDEVTLYTSSNVPNCPFCEKAKAWLEANNIEYNVVDIMIDRDKAEYAYRRTMSLAMPQLEIGNEILIGFIEQDATRVAVEYGLMEAPAPEASTPPEANNNPNLNTGNPATAQAQSDPAPEVDPNVPPRGKPPVQEAPAAEENPKVVKLDKEPVAETTDVK